MKLIPWFLLTLTSIILLCISCSDNNSNLITGPQNSSPALSSDQKDTGEWPGINFEIPEGYSGVTISQTPDGKYVIEYIKKVEWDGVSPMKPGVLYTGSMNDDNIPQDVLDMIEKMEKKDSTGSE